MAKAVAGTKRTKEAIAKAAQQKKGGRKKWTKGKVKERSNNAVFMDKAQYDKLLTDIPKAGKLLSVSTVVDKFKIGGSVARVLMRELLKTGAIKNMETHSKQWLCTTTAAPKKAEETTKVEEKGKKGAKKDTKAGAAK